VSLWRRGDLGGALDRPRTAFIKRAAKNREVVVAWKKAHQAEGKRSVFVGGPNGGRSWLARSLRRNSNG